MTGKPERPIPRPRPDLVRRPTAGFGWLDQALLHDGWLSSLGPDATTVLVLLALAADRHGASYFGRHTMANALGTSMHQVDAALQRLRELGLVDFLPWGKGSRDGVWQLLPIPQTQRNKPRSGRVLAIGQILESLGFTSSQTDASLQRRYSPPTTGAE